MKRIVLGVLVAMLFLSTAKADRGRKVTNAVFSAKSGQTIKVYVDGRLVNNYPQEKVKVKLLPGKKHVKIKIFNRRGRVDFVINNRVFVSQGYTNYFSINKNRYGDLMVKKTAQVQYVAYRPRPVRAYAWDRNHVTRRTRSTVQCY